MSAVVSASLSVLFNEFFKKLEELFAENKPKDVQAVTIKKDPDSYTLSVLDDETTTSTKWKNKDNADMIFANELEKETNVREISVTPDTNFRTKGKMMITIDDIPVFKSKKFTSFRLAQDVIVLADRKIRKDSKVKVFLLSSDGTDVGVTVQVTFGE